MILPGFILAPPRHRGARPFPFRSTAVCFRKRGSEPQWPIVLMMDKKKTKALVHIGAILPNLIRTCRKESDTELTRIWDLWEGIVGGMVAENARPAAFKGKRVLVHVESPVWIHHLQFIKAELIEKINDALGKSLVEEITFKVGPL